MIKLLKTFALAPILVGSVSANPAGYVDGHFSSWEEVPEIIDSITDVDFDQQIRKLHQLTRIKLGDPQSSRSFGAEEHRLHTLQTKKNWSEWWESTGEPVSVLKKQTAKVEQEAFDMAWKFFGIEEELPDPILAVWIPETWTLYITFSNGDYGGREKELWIIDRRADGAGLSKLRGSFGKEGWSVTLSEIEEFSLKNADRVLKAICYLHLYAPPVNSEVAKDEMGGLYYPHSTLRLNDGANRILWNTEGYNFSKTRPEYGHGESGRSYYFLKTIYPDGEQWEPVSHPTNEQLAPYRKFLSLRKPYFCSSAADVIQLFGEHGGSQEKRVMLEWAEKQKAATNPKMAWNVYTGDFGTAMKVNVINFTRREIQATQQQIKNLGDRLQAKRKDSQAGGPEEFDADRAMERELDRYVINMLATEKREEEEAILRYPQPLRELIIVDEHPDDSDLKHLSAAVQAIRDAPDPRLFAQLVMEMHEGTLRIRSLLSYILLNEHKLLDVKPWGDKEEAIAVEACIASLPLAKDLARSDLVRTILCICGGGKVEIPSQNGGRSIEVIPTGNGYSATFGGSANPPSMEEAQDELRRLYKKSKAQVQEAEGIE